MSQFYDQDEKVDDEIHHTEEKPVRTFKIIIIGDSNVGKTCLAYRFCTGKFPLRTETTIGVDFWEKRLEIENEKVKLQIWDTAGQERFRKSMVSHYYRNVNAVVFMYDITRKSSFESMATWLSEYGQFSDSPNVPKIIIGNKCDLGKLRTVNSNDARKFADSYHMPLWEISAKNDDELPTIDSIFLTVAHKLVRKKPIMNKNGCSDDGDERRKRSSKRRSKRIKLTEQPQEKKCCQKS
ncbi:putative Ras-related protein Rab-33 [Exaiptasia diaphana]|uniref:Uncharacterized protein n=1 Tax=Exaiptasia diaphana TaxID=2652724 RepID=A0A913XY65_EXADI|nr:putative Ras-related protein Rab-33 [Exaiptasia diaphana]KXJ23936.1 putative Ras-related protein Rab-33 [Exaiptasia diaphana]